MKLADVIAKNTKYDAEYNFTDGLSRRVMEITNHNLSNNAEYKELSTRNQLISGRSQAFAAIYDAVLAYREGHPISGATLFTTLQKTKVYAPGIDVEKNLRSYDELMKDVVCGDAKSKKEFDEVAAIIKEATVPYLKAYIKQSLMFEMEKCASIERVIGEGSVKKKKPLNG